MTGREAECDKENLLTAQGDLQHSRRKQRTPRMRAGADNRRFSQIIGVNLPSVIDDKLTEMYQQVTDMSPLPDNFDYGHMFESYVWRAIFLTSFTLGIRFGNLDIISGLFLGIFGSTIIFIITYILAPAGILYVDKKIEKKDLSIHERRICLIFTSAFLGVLGSSVNQHYIITGSTAPSYFLPGLVGLSVQVVGPNFGKNRPSFLAVTVGSAVIVGIIIMAFFHDVAIGTLFGLTISAICATINLQIMVALIISQKADMMAAHAMAVIMALYQHLIFSRTLGEYKEDEKATPSITGPILYS